MTMELRQSKLSEPRAGDLQGGPEPNFRSDIVILTKLATFVG